MRHAIFVMDKSGSMETLRNEAIEAYNSYVHELQTEEVPIVLSLLTFSSSSQLRFIRQMPKEVEPLTGETYTPLGMTALYDAIGRAIEMAEDDALIVIYTDGYENASIMHQTEIKAKIEQAKERGVQFVFLASGIEDKFAVVMDIPSSVHDFTGKGLQASFADASAATINYAYTGSSDF